MKKIDIVQNAAILAGRRLGPWQKRMQQVMEMATRAQTQEFYLDLDGVLLNFVDHFLEYLKLPTYPVKSYTDSRIVLNYYKIKDDREFWVSMPSYPITAMGPVKAYITASPEEISPWRAECLERNGFQEAPIICCEADKKVDYIPKGAYVLEDNVATFKSLRQKEVNCYLINRPWTRNGLIRDYRVDSVEEFYQKALTS